MASTWARFPACCARGCDLDLLAHALSQHPPHHGFTFQENAMQIIHPDIDTAVFFVITTFCAILMLAL